jgi:hypothetical protein
MERHSSWSKSGVQVVPLLIVFQTPPAAVPTYIRRGWCSTTATAVIRPPITAGPIERAGKARSNSSETDTGSPAAARLAVNRQTLARTRQMHVS